jgi:hypothetical protein
MQLGALDLPAKHGKLVRRTSTSASESEEIPLNRRTRRMIV